MDTAPPTGVESSQISHRRALPTSLFHTSSQMRHAASFLMPFLGITKNKFITWGLMCLKWHKSVEALGLEQLKNYLLADQPFLQSSIFIILKRLLLDDSQHGLVESRPVGRGTHTVDLDVLSDAGDHSSQLADPVLFTAHLLFKFWINSSILLNTAVYRRGVHMVALLILISIIDSLLYMLCVGSVVSWSRLLEVGTWIVLVNI